MQKVVLAAALVLVQNVAPPQEPRVPAGAPRDPAIEALVADTATVSPEFAADLLLRIATSTRLDDRAWTLELLDRAYHLAAAAEQPVPLTFMPQGSAGTRQASLAAASQAGLDRVTLQSRIAVAVAPYDREHARELFSLVDFDLKPTPCREAITPDVRPYFTSLATMATAGFGTSVRERDASVKFFELGLWGARLPQEILAAVKTLGRFGASADEKEYLLAALAIVFDRGVRDERGFASAGFELVQDTARLASESREQGFIGGARVMDALRKYIVYQLAGPRCSDGAGTASVDQFNAFLRTWKSPGDRIVPITYREIASTMRNAGSADVVPYWETPESRRLIDAARALRFDNRNRPLSDQARATADWRERAEKHLTNVIGWTSARERSEADFFHQKAVLFTDLIELLPTNPVRLRAVREYISFLRQIGPERDRRAAWFFRARVLIELMRRRGSIGDETQWLLEHSQQPVLSLYARAERLLRPASRTEFSLQH